MEGLSLPAEQRRHLLLILKEEMVNAARLADCRSVEIRIAIQRGECHASVCDDGCGLAHLKVDGVNGDTGNGLSNMRARAKALRGTLSFDSPPCGGTAVSLWFPLSRPILA